MIKFLIIFKHDPNIWWRISGVSYKDAVREKLRRNPLYFGAEFEDYLNNNEIIKSGYHFNNLLNKEQEVFLPTKEQLDKCTTFHLNAFKNTDDYIIFQISFITGKIHQLDENDL